MSRGATSGSLARLPIGRGRAIGTTFRIRGSFLRALAWVLAASLALSARVALADIGDGTASDPAPSATAPAVVAPTAPSEPALAPLGTLPGIDVSHHQEAIDWAQVAGSGVRFAIAKASEGRTYVDPRYLENKAGAELNAIAFGAYHFARPDDTPNDAILEADHFVDTAQLGGGNLIPVLDIERTGGLSQADVTAWILAWLDRVTARTGVRPMIYTSPHGWDVRTGDTTAVVDAGYTVLWVAHWDTTTPTVPAADWGGYGWTFWQYDNCGAVPGIVGCVDVDAFAGTSFTGVAIPSPDLTPPSVAISAPVGGPASIVFDEAVRQVTPDNTYMWSPSAGTYPEVALVCRSGKGAVVDCIAGPVRTVVVTTVEPLVLGEAYEVVVNPALVTAAVVDRSGNAATTTSQPLVAPTSVTDLDPTVRYGWRSVSKRSALGGSYALERATGAQASFAFSGGSVTWYTATGRAMGLASVSIDGERFGTFNQFAERPASGVPRRFTGLGGGEHVITVRVLGRSSAKASDTQVVVDAFGVQGSIAKTPAFGARWGRSTGASASDVARASVEVRFRGTGIEWASLDGPDQGRAQILVDGVVVREVDGYAPAAAPAVRSVGGLADGTHTLRIVVLGDARSAATGALVSVGGFTVLP